MAAVPGELRELRLQHAPCRVPPVSLLGGRTTRNALGVVFSGTQLFVAVGTGQPGPLDPARTAAHPAPPPPPPANPAPPAGVRAPENPLPPPLLRPGPHA